MKKNLKLTSPTIERLEAQLAQSRRAEAMLSNLVERLEVQNEALRDELAQARKDWQECLKSETES